MESGSGSFWDNDAWKERSVFAKENLLDGTSTRALPCTVSNFQESSQKSDRATTIAACFLKDYEASKPPSLPPDFADITDSQLRIHGIQHSVLYRWLGLYLATFCLFFGHFHYSTLLSALLHLYTICVFFLDMKLKQALTIQREKRIQPYLQFYLVLLSAQTIFVLFLENPELHPTTMIASFFKPTILFYISQKARDALEALLKTVNVLSKVVMVELFLILCFASVACRLYSNYEEFQNLHTSWLSLFELSTTIVNPGIWMPMYAVRKSNALFFISFLVVNFFYLHSLNLSVVFQVFVTAATEVHQRSASDRERTLQLAFNALRTVSDEHTPKHAVDKKLVRQMITRLRPHYSRLKVNVLMEMMNPLDLQYIKKQDFEDKIRKVLNASIRNTRNRNCLAAFVQILAGIVTVSNFMYVILLTSIEKDYWNSAAAAAIGSFITVLGLTEVAIRINPVALSYYPMTRQNFIFDGLALLGSIISLYGMSLHGQGNELGLEYILTGRAIDMVRTMRFIPMFRDIVERSVKVFPALSGPLVLILTSIHIFTVIGMLLWGGAISVEDLAYNEDLQDYYWLNNFNSYVEGLVLVFNILLVNDWHEMAKVFLYASKCSSPIIVYGYFIVVVVVGVGVMLNVITAFFVETFISKVDKIDLVNSQLLQHKRLDFSIQTIRSRDISTSYFGLLDNTDLLATRGIGRSSSTTTEGETVEFDVFEREGYDKIMDMVSSATATSANKNSPEPEVFASCLIGVLDVTSSCFSEHLQEVGFMILSMKSGTPYESSNFATLRQEYFSESEFRKVTNEMSHALALAAHAASSEEQLLTTIPHPTFPQLKRLELVAILLPQNQILSLYIAKEVISLSPEEEDDERESYVGRGVSV